ncbi:DNA-binding transcriptional repressor FrmR (fragment) [Pseudomonas sp. P14-2025]
MRGAINGLMAAVLESHLREEFPDRGARSDSQQQSINETISIVRSYLR